MQLSQDGSAKRGKRGTSTPVRCECQDENYLEHVGEDMAATKRQRYPPGPDESVHSWSVRCRVLVFGVRNDTNGDEPRKTTSVLDTDVEETLRHDRDIIVCGEGSV